MKGRRQFNTHEAERIRAILLERPRTKSARDKLREVGFYVTDFGLPSPFTIADFNRLITTGEIKVAGEAAATVMPISQLQLRPAAVVADGDAEAARERYRPEKIRHLMVGESAPGGGTFFYHANSIVFRQTHRAFREIFGDTFGENEAFPRFFRDRGFFLDHLCPIAVNGMEDAERRRERVAGVQPLARRIRSAKPQTVIIVMKAIAPEVRRACGLAGVNPTVFELPFPRPEHQIRYVSRLAAFLRSTL